MNNLSKRWKFFSVKLSYLPVFYRLVKFSQQSFIKKISFGKKYYDLYVFHKMTQINKMEKNIEVLHVHKSQSKYFGQIKKTLRNYSDHFQQRLKKKKIDIQVNATKQNYQKEVKGLMYKVMEYLALYYESLQQLVQGRRQVLNDSKYKFDDGQTVQQKKKKFQDFFEKAIGKETQKNNDNVNNS